MTTDNLWLSDLDADVLAAPVFPRRPLAVASVFAPAVDCNRHIALTAVGLAFFDADHANSGATGRTGWQRRNDRLRLRQQFGPNRLVIKEYAGEFRPARDIGHGAGFPSGYPRYRLRDGILDCGIRFL